MRYLASAYANRFKHPIFAAVLTVSVILFAVAGVLELTTPLTIPGLGWEVPPIAAGFFGVFAILAGAIAAAGYGVLLVSRLISRFRDRTAAHQA